MKNEHIPYLSSDQILYLSKVNNCQAGLYFLVNNKWKNNILTAINTSYTSSTYHKSMPAADSSNLSTGDATRGQEEKQLRQRYL